jgi:carbamoyl-phosphate synthase large subunit
MTTGDLHQAFTTANAVLVTGAGGAAAVTLIQALTGYVDVIAADIDPLAVGLYLVDAKNRTIIPRGDDPDFVDALLAAALEHHADLIIPTVDVELSVVSAARARFAAHGITLLVESTHTLDLCLDKARLVTACAGSVRVPTTIVYDTSTTDQDFARLGQPFITKPRRGAGGRGFSIITDMTQLDLVAADGTMLLQEFLPGVEYSIDVLCRPDGHVVAAVPRSRDKVDSGIAVAGRTVRDEHLEDFGRHVATAIGATGVVNVQARCAPDGAPALLEVNARFPGTMTLTMSAGVNMPVLATAGAYGLALPEHVDFREVAVVRHWADVVVPIEEYAAISALHPAPSPSGPTSS